ncbi:MAG: hypothetical protein AAB706_02330 [Patescibacteria group bacterium]
MLDKNIRGAGGWPYLTDNQWPDDEIQSEENLEGSVKCFDCDKITYATVGGLCEECYPKENSELAKQIDREIKEKEWIKLSETEEFKGMKKIINAYKEYRKKIIAGMSVAEIEDTNILAGIDGTQNYWQEKLNALIQKFEKQTI